MEKDVLTKREYEVFCSVLQGLKSREIGELLFVSEKAVKFHLTNIYRKLNIKNRPELIEKYGGIHGRE